MMKAGFFEVDICPSVMMSSTSFDEGSFGNISSPPKLTASVWQSDNLKIAIVGADICVIQRPVWEKARDILHERFGFDGLVCNASHAHSAGPGIRDWVLPISEVEKIEDIKPDLRRRIYSLRHPGDKREPVPPELNQLYLDLLPYRIVDAVASAEKRLEEVRLINGKDIVRDVGHNRRQKMKQGYTFSHAGKGNPDIVGDAGPIDDEIIVLGAVNQCNQIIGVLANYGCHATVAGSKEGLSGDWPYYLRETIRKMINPSTVTVVLNGCCGDVTQVDNISLEPHRFSEQWCKILGQRVAFPAVDILSREPAHEFSVLKHASFDLQLNWREISEEKYRKALDLVNREERGVPGCWFPMGVVLHYWKAKLYPHAKCNLNVVQIGNLVIATNPTETFTQTGMDIKKGSPFPYTMTMGLTNDWLGYMATADAFGPHGGGYEPQLKQGTALEVDAARKVTEKLLEMIHQFHPEKEIPAPRIEKPAKTGQSCWHSPPEE
jgi:neutral ceramidase